MDDTTCAANASKARGVDFGEGNIFKVMVNNTYLIPLFASFLNELRCLADC